MKLRPLREPVARPEGGEKGVDLGFMILPLYVAFDRIDVRLREASKDLGAGRFATFASVTLPLAGPGIAAGVLNARNLLLKLRPLREPVARPEGGEMGVDLVFRRMADEDVVGHRTLTRRIVKTPAND